MELIFLKPYFQEKIWGGNKLKTEFGLDIPSDNIGEAWTISAHKNGISTVISPEKYQRMGLDELYKENKEIFGDEKKFPFPLLIKILDAKDDLSVQVHPDDDYAREHEGEGELGKTECWYIASAEEGSEIVYGHNAMDREEFKTLIKENKWNDLLRKVPVKKGDFFYVPHGTIHAIGKGIVILETQQSSDTTYRVYDYNRVDNNGNHRDLHIKQSIEVSMIPHIDPDKNYKVINKEKSSITTFVSNEYFTVEKWEVNDNLNFEAEKLYYLVTLVDGDGEISVDGKSYKLKTADSFIIPYGDKTISLKGNMTLIASHT